MKELSIEEKAKAYDEAIERAKKLQYDNAWVTSIFPELKDSEDEKKELKKIEQRIADNIPQEFEKYVEHLLSLSDGEGHGSPAKVKEVSAELFKLAKLEQNPAWSEDDEIALIDALWCCKQAASIAKDENKMGNVWYAERWIKSLKDRYTWKPSDEQMEALDDFIYAKYPNIEKYGAAVKSLYQDLKKLKDE